MRNPEYSPVISVNCGIKIKDLSEKFVKGVMGIYGEVTGSPITDEWIFHPDRIKNELRQGRKKLEIILVSGIGAMILSAVQTDDYIFFKLNTRKEEKPDSLKKYYTHVEESFCKNLNKLILQYIG